jgi:flagellin
MIQVNSPFYFDRHQSLQSSHLHKSVEKLASGLRINKSADDAAGLSISSNMNTHLKNSETIKRGIGQGIDYTQVAIGALTEMTDMVQRMRELSLQAMNGTYNDEQRSHIDAEYQQLVKELDRVATTTEYNGAFPFVQTVTTPPPPPIGTTSSLPEVMPSDLKKVDISGIKSFAYIPAGAQNVSLKLYDRGADDDIQIFARNGDHIWGTPLTDGVWINNSVTQLNVDSVVLTLSNGFNAGATYNSTQLNSSTYNGMTFNTILSDNNPINLYEQVQIPNVTEDLLIMVVGANGRFNIEGHYENIPGSLPTAGTTDEALGETMIIPVTTEAITDANKIFIAKTPANATILGLDIVNLKTNADAETAIGNIDKALASFANYQTYYGAKHNSLTVAFDQASTTQVNLQGAKSQILDADMASSMSNLLKTQVQGDALKSMQSISIQSTEEVLRLLAFNQ